MRCPRCRREVADTAAFCTVCGTPLRLADERTRPIDTPLPLDRRGERAGPGREAAPSADPGAALDDLAADLDRSCWDLPRAGVPEGERGPTERGAVTATGAAAPARAAEASADPTLDIGLDELAATEPDVVRVVRPATWRRAGAWAVDALPFAAAAVALARALVREATAGVPPAAGLDGFLDLLARERAIVAPVAAVAVLALAVYATLAHALAGATLGKRLFRLRVVGPDGARPTLARSGVRAALAVASAGLLGLGFLLALFTRSGRALHDFLARTWVVEAP